MPIKGQKYLVKPDAEELWGAGGDWTMHMDKMKGEMCIYCGPHSDETSYFKFDEGTMQYYMPNYCIDWGVGQKAPRSLHYPLSI